MTQKNEKMQLEVRTTPVSKVLEESFRFRQQLLYGIGIVILFLFIGLNYLIWLQ